MGTSPNDATGAPSTLEYFIPNMDCAACARTVKGAVSRCEGTGAVQVLFSSQTLRFTLDETRGSRAVIERGLESLGYPAFLKEEAQPLSVPAAEPWFRSGRGRFVLLTGGLLVLSAVLALAEPAAAGWGFGLATLLGVAPLARKAWAGARRGEPFTINTLVTVAAAGAVVIGQYAEGALVVFLFAVGELLENVATGRARAGIRALAGLAPTTAFLLTDEGVRAVPAAGLKQGDTVQVRPGGRVPADGTVRSGTAQVDESPVTGESMPVSRTAGDPLFAGSISTDAVLEVTVDRPVADSTIARIIHMVEEAEASKAPVARFIDRFSAVYTPAAMLVALAVAVLPPLVGGAPWDVWIYRSLALLLIACPCALVLSVPAAVTSGISAAARNGLLIKGGAVLETIGGVRTVAFDKTGTLTENRPRVTDVIPGPGSSEGEVVRLAAAVEQGSSHPLARAILERAGTLALPAATDARALPGLAAAASVDGLEYAVGSPRYAASLGELSPTLAGTVPALEEQGKTVVVLLRGNEALGLLAIRDEPRADAAAAVRRLTELGVRSVMLTGDNARTGRAVGGALGVDVQAELLPEDKLAAIDALKEHGRVAMVGDGINDAPALARADAGIAMGGGTDVALETAGAALLRQNVSGVPHLIELSRATMANVRQNIVFALGLKAVFLATTLLGLTGLWPAVLSDTGATVLVTANALRLLRFTPAPTPGTGA